MSNKGHNRSVDYDGDPIEGMVDDIKGSAELLAKVLFAGFNIVFLVILGVLLIATFYSP